jgi:hypothetical protein
MSTLLQDYIPTIKLSEYWSGIFSSESIEWLIANRHGEGLHSHCKKENGCLFITTKGFQMRFKGHMVWRLYLAEAAKMCWPTFPISIRWTLQFKVIFI